MINHTPARLALAAALVAGLLSCADPSAPDAGPLSPAKGGGKPNGSTTVTSADPAWGNPGQQDEEVVITGTGFEPGAFAEWQRGGVTDPKILVKSTKFVSSTQLVATITIAADAEVTLYDVAVNYPGRKGGVGTELFEVTTAHAVPEAWVFYDVNDNGQMATTTAGYQPAIFTPSGGVEVVGPTGYAGMAISQDGLTVAGSHNRSHDGDTAMVWVRGAANWTPQMLPRDQAAIGSGVDDIASDAQTGAARFIAGWELMVSGWRGKNPTTYLAPRLWVAAAGGWQRIVLPTGGASPPRGRAWDVGASGVVVGAVDLKAAVWDPDGSGGYTLTQLMPTESRISRINNEGTLAVGHVTGTGTVYWYRADRQSPWNGPTPLPATCDYGGGGHNVDNLLRTAVVCPLSSSRTSAAVLVPPLPYASSAIVFLGGLGKTNPGNPKSMSPNGAWVVGAASAPGGTQGVYWQTGF